MELQTLTVRELVTVKTCNLCKKDKPLADYSKRTKSADGLQPRCRKCAAEIYKANRHRWDRKQHRSTWHIRNPERHRLNNRKSSLLRRYGLTLEAYDALRAAQNYRCAMCSNHEDDCGGLVVDHDHACCPGDKTCGRCLRALLCDRCNRGLGAFNDRLDLLQSGIKYVKHHRAKKLSA